MSVNRRKPVTSNNAKGILRSKSRSGCNRQNTKHDQGRGVVLVGWEARQEKLKTRKVGSAGDQVAVPIAGVCVFFFFGADTQFQANEGHAAQEGRR
jgi:hypothetical protein